MTIPSIIGCMLVVLGNVAAHGAEVKVLSSGGMRSIMEDLGPKFERTTGHKLSITFANTVAATKRIDNREVFDVLVLPERLVNRLVKESKATAGSVAAVARSGMGVAVRKGALVPNISSPDNLKRTLLAAKSVNYPNPDFGGAAGAHFAKVLEQLGIADEVRAKTVFAPKAGMAGVLVANGEAEIGVYLIQELIQADGIEFVGPLPRDLQYGSVISAAVMHGTRNPGASTALIHFLRSPDAAAVIKAKGMLSGSP